MLVEKIIAAAIPIGIDELRNRSDGRSLVVRPLSARPLMLNERTNKHVNAHWCFDARRLGRVAHAPTPLQSARTANARVTD